MKRAEQTDWNNIPLSHMCRVIEIKRTFTKSEMDRIVMGIIPVQMEDKWFIYWKEDSLYFHRSWTGICIYVVKFKNDDSSYSIFEVTINQNPEEYSEAEEKMNIERLDYLINRLLLKNKVALPSSDNVLKNWSFVGRVMLEDQESESYANASFHAFL